MNKNKQKVSLNEAKVIICALKYLDQETLRDLGDRTGRHFTTVDQLYRENKDSFLPAIKEVLKEFIMDKEGNINKDFIEKVINKVK